MWLSELLRRVPEPARIPRRDHDPLRLAEPIPSLRDTPERFVQDIWYGLLFDASRLTTTDGAPVTVLDTGRRNSDRGPDFLGARLKIGRETWLGDVEIHVRSSDWVVHRHGDDPVYNSVVLHVVLVADIWTGRLSRHDGSRLPELILLEHLGRSVHGLLRKLRLGSDPHTIACASQLPAVPTDLTRGWVARLGLERLDERKRVFAQNVAAAGGVEDLLFQAICEALGYSKNGQQMLDLARRVSLHQLRSLGDHDRQALLFGVAGLLGDNPREDGQAQDAFRAELRARFRELNSSDRFTCMRQVAWSFFRLRPANSPTLRIAQVSALVGPDGPLATDPIERLRLAVTASDAVSRCRDLFAVDPGGYWETHLRFGRPTAQRSASIGRGRIDRILVNAVLPILLLVAESTGDGQLGRAVHRVYSGMPAEGDETTRLFAELGVASTSVIDSQGIHQLYRTRCRDAGCFSCAVGRHLMRSAGQQFPRATQPYLQPKPKRRNDTGEHSDHQNRTNDVRPGEGAPV